jgi:PmbA protein
MRVSLPLMAQETEIQSVPRPLAVGAAGEPELPLPADVLQDVAELWARVGRRGEVAEFYLHVGQVLTVDLDPASGLRQENTGAGGQATVRLWTPEGSCRAEGWWHEAQELEELIATARSSASRSGASPPPRQLEPPGGGERPAGALSSRRAQELASTWARELEPLGACIQALLIQQSLGWCGSFHSSGASAHEWLAREQALVRCETPSGALVDGVSTPRLDGGLAPALATQRLGAALEALQGPGAALDPSLPLVLRPPVAGPLVAGLAWALHGDVAASVPGLVRAVGKKIFPSVLSVRDDPRHPEGTVHRHMDDEGWRADLLEPIQAGQLLGFFHTHASAARLGVAPNGRALRAQRGEPFAGTFNFHVAPGRAGLPANRTELAARVETFTTMRQPGVVSLLASGWEYRRGERHRRVGPLELELPVLSTFRQLQGVGPDLTFLPACDGCGTPTLILSPPTWLGDSGSR